MRRTAQMDCLLNQPFNWDEWNARMDARMAATDAALKAWDRQAERTAQAAREVVEAFDRAIEGLRELSR